MAGGLRVLVAPDKFAGTLTAAQAARAIADGWTSVRPGDVVDVLPLADGGPGFVDALAASRPDAVVAQVPVTDPLGRPRTGRVLRLGGTAYVETADACGLHLVEPGERDPMRTTTTGVAALVRAALLAVVAGGGAAEGGFAGRRVVLGLGGSATVDGGLGFLQGLGLRVVDSSGSPVGPGARGVLAARSACWPDEAHADIGAGLTIATDVTSPLTGPWGAVRAFGAQKGLAPSMADEVDAAMSDWARILVRDLGAPRDLETSAGAGAAGGLGAALLALGARRVSGLAVVGGAAALRDRVRASDVVVTGEGRFDDTSMRGKVVGEVLRLALGGGRRAFVVAGDVSEAAPATGPVVVRSLVAAAGSVPAAMSDAATWASRVASGVAADLTADPADLTADPAADVTFESSP